MAKSGEDLLIPNATEHHPVDNNIVLTVFETFASNNRRKRTLCSIAKIFHIAAINPWSDTTITFNAVMNLNSEQLEHQPHRSSVQLWTAFDSPRYSWTAAAD